MGFVDVNSRYGECREQIGNGIDENGDRGADESDQPTRDKRPGGLGYRITLICSRVRR